MITAAVVPAMIGTSGMGKSFLIASAIANEVDSNRGKKQMGYADR